jgi:hypothetical protein
LPLAFRFRCAPAACRASATAARRCMPPPLTPC